jgi:hypothetical protein
MSGRPLWPPVGRRVSAIAVVMPGGKEAARVRYGRAAGADFSFALDLGLDPLAVNSKRAVRRFSAAGTWDIIFADSTRASASA